MRDIELLITKHLPLFTTYWPLFTTRAGKIHFLQAFTLIYLTLSKTIVIYVFGAVRVPGGSSILEAGAKKGSVQCTEGLYIPGLNALFQLTENGIGFVKNI